MARIKQSFAYSWAILDHRGDWVLCRFAEPDRSCLPSKPSPEARIVRVYISTKPESKRELGGK